MANFKIPHVALTNDEKRECMAIMTEGNSLMRAWAEECFGKKNRSSQLRRGLFRWADDPNHPEAINPDDIGLPRSVLDVMLSVRAIESKVMFGYVRMVTRLAHRYEWSLPMTYLDIDDLILEGIIALRDAIYGFSRRDVAFSTYAYCIIKRRLRNKINEATNFGGFNQQGFKLLEMYKATEVRLEKEFGDKASFGTVVLAMQIGDNDIRHLKSMLQKVIRASALTGSDPNNNAYERLGVMPESQDIDIQLLVETLNRQGTTEMQREIVIAAAKGEIPCEEAAIKVQIGSGRRKYRERSDLILLATTSDPKVWKNAVNRAGLTPIQKELVEATIRGEKHFQSRIADKYINPKTNKPYSRMAVTYMLRRACAVIKSELMQMESVAA